MKPSRVPADGASIKSRIPTFYDAAVDKIRFRAHTLVRSRPSRWTHRSLDTNQRASFAPSQHSPAPFGNTWSCDRRLSKLHSVWAVTRNPHQDERVLGLETMWKSNSSSVCSASTLTRESSNFRPACPTSLVPANASFPCQHQPASLLRFGWGHGGHFDDLVWDRGSVGTMPCLGIHPSTCILLRTSSAERTPFGLTAKDDRWTASRSRGARRACCNLLARCFRYRACGRIAGDNAFVRPFIARLKDYSCSLTRPNEAS